MEEEAGHGHGVDGVGADGVGQLVQHRGQGKAYYSEQECCLQASKDFKQVDLSEQTKNIDELLYAAKPIFIT